MFLHRCRVDCHRLVEQCVDGTAIQMDRTSHTLPLRAVGEVEARTKMKEFWKENSKEATVEEMMLDSQANELTQYELPEILSILPCLRESNVLELGAGIGRYTSHLLTKAKHVTAVDFMESFVEKNRRNNGHHSNVTFIQSDVTKLEIPKNSIDLIFSNWLLMYLSNEELKTFIKKSLHWLRPGGFLFFRESCNHRSGDAKLECNPTFYRTDEDYNHLVSSVDIEEPEGGQKIGYKIVLKKKIQAYMKVWPMPLKIKNNPNQVCWLLEKVSHSHDN